jgi:hypothetical protein
MQCSQKMVNKYNLRDQLFIQINIKLPWLRLCEPRKGVNKFDL